MSTAMSTISGLQALLSLTLLALNTISPANSLLWLRASPFICILDALALVLRLLAYHTLLGTAASQPKTLLIIGMERFDEPDMGQTSQGRTVTATLLRHVVFLVSILPLVYIYSWLMGKIRWTVASAWMYITSYLELEIVMLLARRALTATLDAVDDLELGALDEEEKEGEEADGNEKAPLKKKGSESTTDAAASREWVADQAITPVDGMRDAITISTLFAEEPMESTGRTNYFDLESAKDSKSPSNDSLASARLSYIKRYLDKCDQSLLSLGYTLHAIFVYWPFLDIVQLLLKSNLLSSNSFGWTNLRFWLSTPIILAALFIVLAISLSILIFLSILVHATCTIAQSLCPSALGTLRRTLATVLDRAKSLPITGGCVVNAIYYVVGCVCFIAVFLVWSFPTGHIGLFFFSDFMIWVYQLIAVEAVLLLFFGLIYLVLRTQLMRAAGKPVTLSHKLKVSWYLEETETPLLAGVLITFWCHLEGIYSGIPLSKMGNGYTTGEAA